MPGGYSGMSANQFMQPSGIRRNAVTASAPPPKVYAPAPRVMSESELGARKDAAAARMLASSAPKPMAPAPRILNDAHVRAYQQKLRQAPAPPRVAPDDPFAVSPSNPNPKVPAYNPMSPMKPRVAPDDPFAVSPQGHGAHLQSDGSVKHYLYARP